MSYLLFFDHYNDDMDELCECGATIINNCCSDLMKHSYFLCGRIEELRAENERLKIALADAVRRPAGVIPESAKGLITKEDIEQAEARRVREMDKET